MKNGKRDYKREVALYTSKPEVRRKRSLQTMARRDAIKAGLVKKGDGKEVDHITPLSKGGSNRKSNLRVVSAAENRSFSRNSDGSLKSQTSKRERQQTIRKRK